MNALVFDVLLFVNGGGGDVTAVDDDESTFSFSFLLSRNWISLEEQRSTAAAAAAAQIPYLVAY